MTWLNHVIGMLVRFLEVFCCCNYSQVVVNMKPAHGFATKRIVVVDHVFDAAKLRDLFAKLVDCKYFFMVSPCRSGLYLTCNPSPTAGKLYRSVCFTVLSIFCLEYFSILIPVEPRSFEHLGNIAVSVFSRLPVYFVFTGGVVCSLLENVLVSFLVVSVFTVLAGFFAMIRTPSSTVFSQRFPVCRSIFGLFLQKRFLFVVDDCHKGGE